MQKWDIIKQTQKHTYNRRLVKKKVVWNKKIKYRFHKNKTKERTPKKEKPNRFKKMTGKLL